MDSRSDFTLARVPWRGVRGDGDRLDPRLFDINLEEIGVWKVRDGAAERCWRNVCRAPKANYDNDINDG